ncbi:hypothetical protein AGOR_G00205400 [Albula goreensis]|uniref:Bardet-Biedl syndrome 9 n=1 Tax=Albula goreensis TaxID=1534307 RepID=A0A8T3CPX8_9TELE|nr:hypothetical protein AGOR_G00205400 [Albula goreensis]
MSLFKARDWWSAVLGEGEEFDQGCLCVGDVDNSGSGHDKIVVGSYMGLLRIFQPHASTPSGENQAEDQLLEVQLRDPIIQVEVGKFVSCSDLLHLAVLHPRKLSVYAITGTAHGGERGARCSVPAQASVRAQPAEDCLQHDLRPIRRSHRAPLHLHPVHGRHADVLRAGELRLRPLPARLLLPGPLSYCARTDTFITVSSTRQVESYKYETLAVATDADTRQDSEQQKKSSGKRLMADWTLVIGEQALDICVPSYSPSASSIFVLGERNLYCLKDNGQIRFMKKLEYNPSCFLPYASVTEGTTNTLLANHNNMLLVYQDVTLKWAAQLSSVPIAVRVANFPELRGVVVTLSGDGHLQCSYMGTDPSFFMAPKVEAREVNYEEVDAELKTLHKVIREATRTQDILPKVDMDEEVTVTATVSASMDAASQAVIPEISGVPVPSVTVKVTVKCRSAVQSPKLTVCVQPPLSVTQEQFVLDSMAPGATSAVEFSAFLNGEYPPADLGGDVAVSYSTPTGVPRVAQCRFSLPLRLVCCPTSTSKNAKYKITIDTNKPPVNLNEVFPDFAEKSEDGNTMAFQLIAGAKVTVLASKTSQRYRIQSETFEDIWLVAKELVQRFDRHFTKQGVKDFRNSFSGPLPLTEYFQAVDHHFELRVSAEKYQDLLSERAVQFRAIQRRLLTRFKDKTPAPLQNLDTLMEGTYRQVIALADAAEENRAALCQAFARLRSATHLLIMLVTLWQGLSAEQTGILEATLLPLLQDTPQLGWEESVDAAVSHLLRTCLSRSSKDQALSLSTSQLSMPKDTARLKKHITLLCDRLGKGGRLSLSSEAHAPVPVIMPGGCEPIAELDQEEPAVEPETVAKFVKKRQPSKKVKTKTDAPAKEPGKESSKESGKESAKDSGKESTKEPAKAKESGKESAKDSGKTAKESGKVTKESTKEAGKTAKESSKESSKDSGKAAKESGKEPGKATAKVARKTSVKVKEKKKEPEAEDG